MNRESNTVYELIKSMTKGEKRYFQNINSNSSLDSSLRIQLYNTINKSKEINDLAKDKIKNYKVIKNQLYNSIIETLSFYHLKNSASCYSEQVLMKAKILSLKNMYKECLSFIEKETPNLQKQEAFIQLIKLHEIKDSVYSYYKPDPEDFEKENTNLDTIINLSIKYQNYIEAKSFFKKTIRVLVNIDEHQEEPVQYDYLSELNKLEKKALSKKALRYIHTTKLHYYIAYKIFDKAHEYQLILNKGTEERFAAGALSIEFVAYGILRLILIELEIGVKNIDTRLNELKVVEEKISKKSKKLLCYWSRNYCEIWFFWKQYQLNNILTVFNRIPQNIKHEISTIDPRQKLSIYHIVILSQFLHEKYDIADELIKESLKNTNTATNINAYTICLLLSIMIQFELGNYKLLEGLSHSIRRKLKAVDKLNFATAKLLNFLSHSLQKDLGADLSHHFRKIVEQIEQEIIDDKIRPELLQASSYLIYYWLNAKLLNLKLDTYLKQRFDPSITS